MNEGNKITQNTNKTLEVDIPDNIEKYYLVDFQGFYNHLDHQISQELSSDVWYYFANWFINKLHAFKPFFFH